MGSLNILHVIPYFIRATKSGGPAIALQRLATGLINRGNNITVICSNGNMDEDVDIQYDGDIYITRDIDIPTIYLKRINLLFPRTYYFSPSLPKWLDDNISKFDIVTLHGTWTYFSLAGWQACRRHNIPYLQYVHGYLDPWAFYYHYWKKMPYWYLVEQNIYNQASGIIAVTRDEMRYVQQHKIKSSIRVIPYGITMPQSDTSYTHLVYEKWPQLNGKKYILFISRLHKKKGIELLLRAWANLHNNYPEYMLVIAGSDEGGYLAHLESLRNELNLVESVLFIGHVLGDMKNAIFKNANIFVLPSYSEGLPNAVLEAMAFHLPVVITPGCHIPEVEQYNAGIIVPTEVLPLTNGLSTLLLSPDLCQKMGENAYNLSLSKFSQEKMVNDFEAWCLEILRK